VFVDALAADSGAKKYTACNITLHFLMLITIIFIILGYTPVKFIEVEELTKLYFSGYSLLLLSQYALVLPFICILGCETKTYFVIKDN